MVSSPANTNPITSLRYGSNGAEVKELQEDLIALGYDLGKWGADGDYGNATVNAVKKFQ
jgi:N-acetylmuramoyl-L-alanine amidase